MKIVERSENSLKEVMACDVSPVAMFLLYCDQMLVLLMLQYSAISFTVLLCFYSRASTNRGEL